MVNKAKGRWRTQPAPYGLPTPCLIHPNATVRTGHVQLEWRAGDRKTRIYAHRLAWMSMHGPIPDGMVVRHKCDVPNCVNPDHLELGTVGDNNRDAVERGQHRPMRGELNGHHKLTVQDVLAIRASTDLQRVLADRYGVDQTLISRIKLRKIWKHIEEREQ